jgi:hypothetical protein
MKTTVLALFLLCAATGFGQAAVGGSALSAQPSVLEFQSHEATASQHSMGTAQNLLESAGYTWAQGERPLWEVSPASHQTPLGDSARMLRKEHSADKKAEKVWNNN